MNLKNLTSHNVYATFIFAFMVTNFFSTIAVAEVYDCKVNRQPGLKCRGIDYGNLIATMKIDTSDLNLKKKWKNIFVGRLISGAEESHVCPSEFPDPDDSHSYDSTFTVFSITVWDSSLALRSTMGNGLSRDLDGNIDVSNFFRQTFASDLIGQQSISLTVKEYVFKTFNYQFTCKKL